MDNKHFFEQFRGRPSPNTTAAAATDTLAKQNRLITKFLLWATASAASAIYAFNPVSAIGSYCLYCSAILRTARLAVVFHMFGQKTRWADDPSLDAKMEDFAYIL